VYTIAIVADAPQQYDFVMNIGTQPSTPPLATPRYFQAQVGYFGWILWAPVCPEGYVAMGTVVTTDSGDDTPAPAKGEATCVRSDLTVLAAPLPASTGFSTARIEAPINNDFGDTAVYLDTGTMSVVFPSGNANPYPVNRVLAVELPMLIDTPHQAWLPHVTSLLAADNVYSEPVLAKALLVPFSAMLNGEEQDSEYTRRGVGWMVENSPFVRVERLVRWDLEFFTVNTTTSDQQNSVEFTKGITNAQTTTMTNTGGVSVTAEGGVKFLGIGGKISGTVSYEFGYETQTAVTALDSKTTTVSINVSPCKAAAAWREQTTLLLKLNDLDGTVDTILSEPMYDSLSFVTDDYPVPDCVNNRDIH
jgi:hypothetical protein